MPLAECNLARYLTDYFFLSSYLKVDYIPYCDELANEIGCRPNFVRLFFSDPGLALRCFFGPCTPSQYRLMGPGTWAGAKKAIEDAPGNVIYATKTRVLPQKVNSGPNTATAVLKLLVFLVVVLAILMRYF